MSETLVATCGGGDDEATAKRRDDDVDEAKMAAAVVKDGERRRRKTRRGKPKRRKLKPYSRLWRRLDEKQQHAYAYGQPEAPYNTTQFLIADHNDLQGLDAQLSKASESDKGGRPPARARDSSFSVDSDEDYFYSSPEDEGDFLSKEFSNTYEDLHAERIGAMSKSQLIQEYLILEEKVSLLEARLKATSGPGPQDHYKQEMDRLLLENQQLRRENDLLLLRTDNAKSPTSSVDSESDSSSSTSSSSSSSSSSNDTNATQDLK